MSCRLLWIAAVAALLAPSLSMAQGSGASMPDFTWRGGGSAVPDKVRLANGDLAQVAQGPLGGRTLAGACEFSRLEIRQGKTGELRSEPLACDDRVNVLTAYPSPERAKVVIVATNCGGTACHAYSDYFVVYLARGGVRTTRVGTGFYGPKPTVFSFWFEGDDLRASTLHQFHDGTRNPLDDLLPSTRHWHASGHYVDTRFLAAWRPFLGEHPEAVLADAKARAPIVKRVKPEQFRALRAAMSGPGQSTLVNGRYLVMNACMKSNCPYQFGAVVVDGFTGDLHAMSFTPEDKHFLHVGTRKLDPRSDHAWLDAVDTQDVLRLSIATGALKVEPAAGR